MKYVTTNYGNKTEVLKFPDHYVALAVTVDDAGIEADSDGKKIVKAGTVVKGKASSVIDGTDQYVVKDNTASAEGVLLTDVDVTYGPASGAMIIHGYLDLSKVTTAMGEAPSAEAKAALTMIKFIK